MAEKSYPTAEQTQRMWKMVASMFLPSHSRNGTLTSWNRLTEEQAEDRLHELDTIIQSNYDAQLVPEA